MAGNAPARGRSAARRLRLAAGLALLAASGRQALLLLLAPRHPFDGPPGGDDPPQPAAAAAGPAAPAARAGEHLEKEAPHRRSAGAGSRSSRSGVGGGGAIDRKRKGKVAEYEQEFPFETTCPDFAGNELVRAGGTGKNVTVALAYHVSMMRNWKTVVLDQLQTLHQCGLGHVAQHMLLSYSGGDEMGELSKLMRPYDFSFDLVRVVQPERTPWEGTIMNAMHTYCKKHPEAVMYYFHNKGVSKYEPDWRNRTDEVWTYSRVLYWRKFMEYFTLERPQLCLEEILNKNKSACGVNFLHSPHFSGNFWVASCEYLATLPPMNLTDPNLDYVAAELWLGTRYDESRWVSLWQRKLNLEVQLYRHWIQPSEYRFPEDLQNVANVAL
jgi:hypothetical protein